MIQSANQVSLYRKIDQEMLERAGFKAGQPQFFYNSSEGLKEIEINENFDNILTVNEFDTAWDPSEHDLIIRLSFIFHNASALFGEEGVTMGSNIIGTAVHIHSKTSSCQKNISFGSISNNNDEVEIIFEHEFPKGSLRGTIDMDFFIYLKKMTESHPYHADKVGMRLSEEDIYNLSIVADGDGSIFPMTEFSDKNGPLWMLEKNWADAGEDVFDSSNVNLSLNTAHPLFEQIKGGKTRAAQALMNEIMINAMSLIMQQALIVEENDLNSVDENYSNSILAIVKYWVDTFEVDTTSSFTIMNSLRRNLERKMLGGE